MHEQNQISFLMGLTSLTSLTSQTSSIQRPDATGVGAEQFTSPKTPVPTRRHTPHFYKLIKGTVGVRQPGNHLHGNM